MRKIKRFNRRSKIIRTSHGNIILDYSLRSRRGNTFARAIAQKRFKRNVRVSGRFSTGSKGNKAGLFIKAGNFHFGIDHNLTLDETRPFIKYRRKRVI